MRFPPQLQKGEFVRLEAGEAWYEVVRVTPCAAYLRSLSVGTRTFLARNERVKLHGLDYEMPLPEPKMITVPVVSNVLPVSVHSFVAERSATRP